MALIDKRLSELKLSREAVDVYRDRISEESLTGVVADFNDEFLYMSLLTDDGENNGISVFFRPNITRIRTGGNVRSSISELGKFRATEVKFPNINLTSIDTVLSSIQSQYGYVNLHTEDMDDDICFIGEITDQDEKWVSLLGYGTMTTRDTNTILLEKEEISRVDAGAKYEESIKFLATKANR
jgi:flagellar basal body rod protein FlgB